MRDNKVISIRKADIVVPLILPVLVLFVVSIAVAETVTWNNPSGGNWNDPANWVPVKVPGPGDDVVVPGPGLINVDADVTINSLTLGPDGTIELDQNSGLFTIGVDCINDLSTGSALCWDRLDSVSAMSWYAAAAYCSDSGARLPTIEELVLFATKGGKIYMEIAGYLYGAAFDLRPWLVERQYLYSGTAFYWSSTGCFGPLCSPVYAWVVDFSNGSLSTTGTGSAHQVRCVRAGQ